MNQLQQQISTVTSSICEEIGLHVPDRGHSTCPRVSVMPDTSEMTANNIGPAIPDAAQYEEIPGGDSGAYIISLHSDYTSDTSETNVKEVYTRSEIADTARHAKTPDVNNGYIHIRTPCPTRLRRQ